MKFNLNFVLVGHLINLSFESLENIEQNEMEIIHFLSHRFKKITFTHFIGGKLIHTMTSTPTEYEEEKEILTLKKPLTTNWVRSTLLNHEEKYTEKSEFKLVTVN
jgi:hypothetical protein